MAEPITIYKITILYMLHKANMPMTNTQISNFFLERDYTDYFRVQEGLNSLEDSGLICSEKTHRATQYLISASGEESLRFFHSKLNEQIEKDVCSYLDAKRMLFHQENSVIADYRYTKNCNYEVTCRLRSDADDLIGLKLTVKQKEQAEAICRNWESRNEDVYALLMDTLLT